MVGYVNPVSKLGEVAPLSLYTVKGYDSGDASPFLAKFENQTVQSGKIVFRQCFKSRKGGWAWRCANTTLEPAIDCVVIFACMFCE